jgi:excisionase family DNA binding protein
MIQHVPPTRGKGQLRPKRARLSTTIELPLTLNRPISGRNRRLIQKRPFDGRLQVITVAKAASMLRMKRSDLYRLADEGRLTAMEMRGTVYFRLAEIESLAEVREKRRFSNHKKGKASKPNTDGSTSGQHGD